MQRIERRIFRLNETIARLKEEARLVEAELERHRLIDDDAQVDAALGNYIDREEAGLTGADVRRFTRSLQHINDRISRLEETRERLLSRLDD